MYEALLEFPEVWGGVRKNPFRGGGMDIFGNYTMSREANLVTLAKVSDFSETGFVFSWLHINSFGERCY